MAEMRTASYANSSLFAHIKNILILAKRQMVDAGAIIIICKPGAAAGAYSYMAAIKDSGCISIILILKPCMPPLRYLKWLRVRNTALSPKPGGCAAEGVKAE